MYDKTYEDYLVGCDNYDQFVKENNLPGAREERLTEAEWAKARAATMAADAERKRIMEQEIHSLEQVREILEQRFHIEGPDYCTVMRVIDFLLVTVESAQQ